MKSFITVPKLINELGADERTGSKGLPSHLKSEYAIFDNQRDGWAKDPNRIKGCSQSAMLPKMKHQEGSIMKFFNKNRNKISGSLLHYNKNLNEKDQGDFLDLISSNFLRNKSVKSSDTDLYPNSGCSLINFSASSNKAFGILGDPYFFGISNNKLIHRFNYYASYMSQNLNNNMILLHICNKREAI